MDLFHYNEIADLRRLDAAECHAASGGLPVPEKADCMQLAPKDGAAPPSDNCKPSDAACLERQQTFALTYQKISIPTDKASPLVVGQTLATGRWVLVDARSGKVIGQAADYPAVLKIAQSSGFGAPTLTDTTNLSQWFHEPFARNVSAGQGEEVARSTSATQSGGAPATLFPVGDKGAAVLIAVLLVGAAILVRMSRDRTRGGKG